MSLVKDVDSIKKQLELMNAEVPTPSVKSKVKNWTLPARARAGRKSKVKEDKVLAFILKNNKTVEFKWCVIKDGLIQIGEYEYKAFEPGAVYIYKNIPVVTVYEWRLLAVGGLAEDVQQTKPKLLGSKEDVDFADKNGIGDFAQRTVIRAVQKTEVDKVEGSKKKLSIIWIVILGAIVVYFLSQAFT